MQEPICCFIGHHFIPEPDESWLMMSLDREITYQIERGVRVFAAGGVVQGAVERVRIGGIGDHGRAVGRCPFGYDEIGTGCGCAIGEEGCRREAILEFSHRFSGFDPKCTKQILNGKTQRVRYVAFYLDIRALCRIFTTYASALHSGGYPPPVRRYVIVI